MSFYDLANTIRTRFARQIKGVDIAYDNAPFEEPNTIWIRFSILPGSSMQADFGDPKRFRTPGVAMAQVFAPIDRGDADAYRMADKIVLAFRSLSDDGVVYRTPGVTVRGRSGRWWQINVSCPFYADELEPQAGA